MFDALNRQTVAKVKKTGLPYFLITEADQVGDTFGERYTNAITFVYNQGFDNVISIGNDTPKLQAHQLRTAANHVQSGRVVLGPTKDGGFYLLGLPKRHFNSCEFLRLPWQQASLYTTLVAGLQPDHNVVTLGALQDIDTLVDVRVLKNAYTISEKIKALLVQIVSIRVTDISTVSPHYSLVYTSDYFNKGSPFRTNFS